MRKINYPSDPKALKDFHAGYLKLFDDKSKAEIDKQLADAPLFENQLLTFDKLAVSSFSELIKIKSHLKSFIKAFDKSVGRKKKKVIKNSFNQLFDYSKKQPAIADFFMNEQDLGLNCCYYCGIDYINSFKDIGDYSNVRDFLNRASISELQIIKGIGEKTAKKIEAKRNKGYITSISKITNDKKIKQQLKNTDFRRTHNHFTLDHVLPQSKYKFLSLSLYNLVPSCYSCNAKFKKDRNFLDDDDIIKISPTSSDYSLDNNLNFSILYSGKIEDIKTTSDFLLVRNINGDNAHIENYISIFKLEGRYVVHKNIILQMIETKIKYPPGKINSLAFDLGQSRDEFKKDIFGRDIFDEVSSSPFHKLKRDIARDLKIL